MEISPRAKCARGAKKSRRLLIFDFAFFFYSHSILLYPFHFLICVKAPVDDLILF